MFEEALAFNACFYFDKGKEILWQREKKLNHSVQMLVLYFPICKATQASSVYILFIHKTELIL